jgi:tRNA (guanine-N7-)-methyltransferase
MPRTLKYDIPGRDFRIYLDEFGEPPTLERWGEAFAEDLPDVRELVVDIGFGRGEFLIDLARRRPRTAFVGIERSYKRTLKMARRLPRLGVSNVRLLEAEAQYAILDFFPANAISEAWINFPDPWPKDRHGPRRLVQPAFVRDLCERMKVGGSLQLATDDPAYAQQMTEVLAGETALENVYAPAPYRLQSRERVPTAYELEWKELGRTCHYFSYRKRAGTGGASIASDRG